MTLSVVKTWLTQTTHSFLAAVTFYTTIPFPSSWQLEFTRIARWAPLIGFLLGGLLSLVDAGLFYLQMPLLTRSAILVSLWVFLTGGLHLDGVVDTADGLAVSQPEQRLRVMQDSVAGAFGVMAAAIVLLLKVVALTDLSSWRWLGLMAAAGWGRWGQVVAIAFYPYLKPTGKGAFHKQEMCPFQDISFGALVLIGWSGLGILLQFYPWQLGVLVAISGMSIAVLTGFWFYQQLSGHTGDTYGATVEWTEALLLCLLTTYASA